MKKGSKYRVLKDTLYFSKGDVIIHFRGGINDWFYKANGIKVNNFFDTRICQCDKEYVVEVKAKNVIGGELI